MVCNATGSITFAACVARDRGEEGMEFGSRLGIEELTAVLRAENDVDNDKA